MKIVKATSDHDVAFHEYHVADGARVGRQKVCKGCSNDLTDADIVKGLEVTKGKVVTFTAQELATLPLKSSKTIEIERFVLAEELSPLMFEEAAYYITPEPGGEKAFALVVKGMQKAQKVAIGKIALRQREHVCSLLPTVRGGLLMSLMYFSDEIREMPQVQGMLVAEDELELIGQVIKRYSKPFEHAQFKDDYNEALKVLIAAKMSGQTVVAASAPAPTMDLKSALQSLLQQ